MVDYISLLYCLSEFVGRICSSILSYYFRLPS